MNHQEVVFRVNTPSIEEFAEQYPQYGPSARNEYRFLFDRLMSPDSFVRCRVVTLDLELPAVAGVAAICFQAVQAHETVQWSNRLKQFVGAVICSLMTANGFEKTETKRSIPHPAFTKGELYKLVMQ